jgi:diguanylate cyclase
MIGRAVTLLLEFAPTPLLSSRAGRLSAENRALRRRLGELEREARTDPLTGLLNRRAVDEAFEREAARARREEAGLCLALIDLDDFKALNDSAGHASGDRLLTECAEAWRRAVRPVDELARIGGDEFAVLLPRCTNPEAEAVLARLEAATPAGQSVSWGTTAHCPAEPAHLTWARADRALYATKASRRRRCTRCNVVPLRPDGPSARTCASCGSPLRRIGRSPVAAVPQRLSDPPAGTPGPA